MVFLGVWTPSTAELVQVITAITPQKKHLVTLAKTLIERITKTGEKKIQKL